MFKNNTAFNPSSLTSISRLCRSHTEGKDMSNMFKNNTANTIFNQPRSNFETPSVCHMPKVKDMFCGNNTFNQSLLLLLRYL